MSTIHHDEPQQHPWWQHVPAERKRSTLRQRRRQRWLRRILSRPGSLILLLLLNGGLWTGIAAAGAGLVTLLALVPLAVIPCLAAVNWWLTWKEFHD